MHGVVEIEQPPDVRLVGSVDVAGLSLTGRRRGAEHTAGSGDR
jgi:hypothetical protein